MSTPREELFKKAKFIALSDYDGTITTEDSNDAATDNLGFGVEKRRALNVEILNRSVHFRDGFTQMIDSIAEKCTLEEMKDYLVKSEFTFFLSFFVTWYSGTKSARCAPFETIYFIGKEIEC